MTADRDTDRLLRAWFHDEDDVLPDHVLDLVLVGLPSVPQARRPLLPVEVRLPRRRWLRVALVAALLAVLVGGLLAVSGGLPLTPRLRAFVADPALTAGRYVVDAPFRVRFALDIPSGWDGAEYEGDSALLVRSSEPAAQLWFLRVDGLYRDPCRSDLGLSANAFRTPDELATALASLPGIGASIVTHPIVGGRRAASVTLLGPQDPSGCTDDTVLVAGVPLPYALGAGERHRFWILEIDGQQLVVAAQDGGAGSAAADELDAMVASLEFGVAPITGPRPTPRPAPSLRVPEVILRLPRAGLPVGPGFYVFDLPVYDGSSGTLEPVSARHEGAIWVEAGWFAADRGVVNAAGPSPTASFRIWTIARAHLDPCRWQTSALGTVPDRMLGTSDDLTRTLSAYWPPDLDPLLTPVGYRPPPDAPSATEPTRIAWAAKFAHRLELVVPADLDLATCDGGEARLWVDPSGAVRTASPGERIELTVVDLDPGIIALDAATLPGASVADRESLRVLARDAWAGITQT